MRDTDNPFPRKLSRKRMSIELLLLVGYLLFGLIVAIVIFWNSYPVPDRNFLIRKYPISDPHRLNNVLAVVGIFNSGVGYCFTALAIQIAAHIRTRAAINGASLADLLNSLPYSPGRMELFGSKLTMVITSVGVISVVISAGVGTLYKEGLVLSSIELKAGVKDFDYDYVTGCDHASNQYHCFFNKYTQYGLALSASQSGNQFTVGIENTIVDNARASILTFVGAPKLQPGEEVFEINATTLAVVTKFRILNEAEKKVINHVNPNNSSETFIVSINPTTKTTASIYKPTSTNTQSNDHISTSVQTSNSISTSDQTSNPTSTSDQTSNPISTSDQTSNLPTTSAQSSDSISTTAQSSDSLLSAASTDTLTAAAILTTAFTDSLSSPSAQSTDSNPAIVQTGGLVSTSETAANNNPTPTSEAATVQAIQTGSTTGSVTLNFRRDVNDSRTAQFQHTDLALGVWFNLGGFDWILGVENSGNYSQLIGGTSSHCVVHGTWRNASRSSGDSTNPGDQYQQSSEATYYLHKYQYQDADCDIIHKNFWTDVSSINYNWGDIWGMFISDFQDRTKDDDGLNSAYIMAVIYSVHMFNGEDNFYEDLKASSATKDVASDDRLNATVTRISYAIQTRIWLWIYIGVIFVMIPLLLWSAYESHILMTAWAPLWIGAMNHNQREIVSVQVQQSLGLKEIHDEPPESVKQKLLESNHDNLVKPLGDLTFR